MTVLGAGWVLVLSGSVLAPLACIPAPVGTLAGSDQDVEARRSRLSGRPCGLPVGASAVAGLGVAAASLSLSRWPQRPRWLRMGRHLPHGLTARLAVADMSAMEAPRVSGLALPPTTGS